MRDDLDTDPHPEGFGASSRETVLARALRSYQDSSTGGDAFLTDTLIREDPELAEELRLDIEALEGLRHYLDDEPPRRQFGDFQVIELIGMGSMGIVYKAWQSSMKRHVALKILPPAHVGDVRYVDRFRREACIAGRLNHANIIPVYATGMEDGILYYAMELAAGSTLSQVVRQLTTRYGNSKTTSFSSTGKTRVPDLDALHAELEELEAGLEDLEPLRLSAVARQDAPSADGPAWSPPDDMWANSTETFDMAFWRKIAEAFAGAAEGLQYAHTHGVIHRDIKPSNLILELDGRLRILDFGIAHAEDEFSATRSDERVGTLLYMSPEQATGHARNLGPATDIYSLGATLYEVLAWQPPFPGDNSAEVIDGIVRRDPVPPSAINRNVPRDLELVTLKCLRKEASRRYGIAEALAQDLRRFVRGDPVEVKPESRLEVFARKLRRSRQRIVRGSVAAIAAIAVATLGLGWYTSWQDEQHRDFEQIVREGVMHTLQAQILSFNPSANATPGERVRVLHETDRPSRGSRLSGDSNVSYASRNVVFLSGPRVGATAAEDSLRRAVDLLQDAVKRFPMDPVGHYHLARALFARRNLVDAEKSLRRVLDLDPDFLPAKNLLASIVEATSPAEAEALREAVQQEARQSKRWSSAWLEAQRAALQARWRSASAAFDAMPADDLDSERDYIGYSIETFLTRGVSRLKTGESVLAAADFGAAGRDLPGWLEPKLLVARAYIQAGNVESARREYEKLWEQARAGNKPSPDEVALAVARDCRAQEMYEDALRWTGEVSDSSSVQRETLRSEILSLSGDLDGAWKAARLAAQKEPPSPDVLLALGNVAFLRRDLPEARRWYEKAREADPYNPRAEVALAACLENDDRLDDALEKLDSVIRTDPFFTPAHYDRARVLAALGRLDEALDASERAIELAPGDALAYNNLGTIHDRLGDRDAARKCFERALELDPEFALAYYNLGWVYHRQRLIHQAADAYENALELGLDAPSLRSLLGACLIRLGDNGRAARLLAEAIDDGLEDSATYHDLGAADFNRGMFAEAAKAYKRSVELEPYGDHAYWLWVQCLERLDRLEEASAVCRRGIRLMPQYVNLYSEQAWIWLYTDRTPSGDELRRDVVLLERGAGLPGGQLSIQWALEDYRRAFWPRCASYASVDHLFEGPELLVGARDRWPYLRGRTGESPGAEWTKSGEAAEGWETGPGPFGYPESPGLGTVLDDMPGNYSSVYLRRTFRVEAAASVTRLLLRVESDDGLIVYINGQEAWRRGLGEKGLEVPPDGLADSKFQHWKPEEARIDPSLLVPGENVLAVRWVNSALDDARSALQLQLEALPPSRAEISRRMSGSREALQTGTEPEDIELLTYLEGRLAEEQGALADAATRYDAVVMENPNLVVPRLRLARIYRQLDAPEQADALLRGALEVWRNRADRALWEEWLETSFVDLRRRPAEVIRAFRSVATPREAGPGFLSDLEWLLEKLSRKEPLRINCGGKDCVVRGEAWSRDRFSLGGAVHVHAGMDSEAARIVPCLDATERNFEGSRPERLGYRIPLPPGQYEVTLRFTEGHHREPGLRRSDVLLEGKVLLADFEPLEIGGFEVPVVRTFRAVEVSDGALNIDFRSIRENPQITAIEVLPAAGSR